MEIVQIIEFIMLYLKKKMAAEGNTMKYNNKMLKKKLMKADF